jgi:hypothetical protein
MEKRTKIFKSLTQIDKLMSIIRKIRSQKRDFVSAQKGAAGFGKYDFSS